MYRGRSSEGICRVTTKESDGDNMMLPYDSYLLIKQHLASLPLLV